MTSPHLHAGSEAMPLYPARLDILVIAAVTILTDLAYYTVSFLPRHDLLEALSIQNYLYSGLVYNDAVPQWLPFVHWGIKSEVLQYSISSIASVIGMIGYLMHYEKVSHLAYLSLTIEKVLFSLSLYMLCLSIYRTRLASVLVPCLGVATIFWFWGPVFNLYQISLVPLALLLLLRFSATGSWANLWLCGGVLATGQAFALFAPVLALVFAAVALALFVQHPHPRIFVSRPSAGAFAAFILCAGLVTACALLFKFSLEDLSIIALDRSAGAAVSLQNFLRYGVAQSLDTPAQALVLGYLDTARWTAYLGLLPLIGAGFALVGDGRRAARALAAGALVLAFLTQASGAAALMFQFPAMGYFRHLQHLYPLLKVFLILFAGFAVDRALLWLQRRPDPQAAPSPWAVFLGFGLVAVAVDGVAGPILREGPALDPVGLLTSSLDAQQGASLAAILSYGRLGVYALACGLAVFALRRAAWPAAWRSAVATVAVIAAVVVDIGSYQWQARRQWTWEVTNNPALHAMMRTRAPVLPLTRQKEPGDPWQSNVLATISGTANSIRSSDYALFDLLVQVDRCLPKARTYFMAPGPAHMVTLRGGSFVPGIVGSQIPWDDRALMTVLGCEAHKFRLIANGIVAASDGDRDRLIRETAQLDATVILGPMPPGEGAPADSLDGPPVDGSVSVVRYRPDRIELAVTNPAPYSVWLVYADAYDEGWRATVDGASSPVLPAYGGFKAVALPPGSSMVVWSFAPRWVAHGIAAYRLFPGLVLLALLAAMLVDPRSVWRLTRADGFREPPVRGYRTPASASAGSS